MAVPPSGSDLLLDAIFFVLVNGLFIGLARHKADRSEGAFRWLFYLPVVPLVILVSRMCWAWKSDASAHHLWPFELVLAGIPSALAWTGLLWAERRARVAAAARRADRR